MTQVPSQGVAPAEKRSQPPSPARRRKAEGKEPTLPEQVGLESMRKMGTPATGSQPDIAEVLGRTEGDLPPEARRSPGTPQKRRPRTGEPRP
ncbi:putative serine/arginine-rich splicing factor SR45 isoform X1 [Iris pallida]|uniref:Serine/arginine-rich splicing factor SR45 isoform X1 n=1 Tax=Iris pallida TaxID=29817 RepID=A0AAX6ESA5_IRIPA|nr:putative serine/arginine-rich splicing factor SR45 isoform X1 [Iris pallida]KAJ6806956.1 putative serine/arginine-rich splicing factor SR45 isoform X1 [Iris pallida]